MSAKITDFFGRAQKGFDAEIKPKRTYLKASKGEGGKGIEKSNDVRMSLVLTDIFNDTQNGQLKNLEMKGLKLKKKNRTKASNVECSICHKFFISDKGLYVHMSAIHFSITSNNFECDICGKTFNDKLNTVNHMKSHVQKVNCTICQTELKIKSVREHMRSIHGNGTNFKCKTCSKIFKTKNYLSVHEKSHDKRFECETCNKKLTSNYTLNKHKTNYHLNPRNFTCEICGKKFYQKQHLKTHQKSHDNYRQKPLKCQRCDYAIDRKNDYQNHMKSHQRQDEKFVAMKNPIKCEKCPTFCKNEVALIGHNYLVHPKELFQCDLCGRYLKAKFSLIRHINVQHKI